MPSVRCKRLISVAGNFGNKTMELLSSAFFCINIDACSNGYLRAGPTYSLALLWSACSTCFGSPCVRKGYGQPKNTCHGAPPPSAVFLLVSTQRQTILWRVRSIISEVIQLFHRSGRRKLSSESATPISACPSSFMKRLGFQPVAG
jgi:hypothetical protein